ncbi:anti-sigma factor family protein [Rhizobium sp. HT1-10]|uniref:anti-sigma factor family protein n=1 Tax=Rhizobium sp. HT1-10 TaxID=3111638 RepID=UPI003C19D436
MKRPITEEDIQAYVDNALQPERHDEVEAYLSANQDEALRASAFKADAATLRAALDPVAREPIPMHLNLSQIAARRQPEKLPAWRIAAAAMVLIVAGATGGWAVRGYSLPPSEGVAALAQEASASYTTFAGNAVQPVEFKADDLPGLTDIASMTLGTKTVVPDLSRSGYSLMGGRIVSTVHGPGFMLMYNDGKGNRLVMLARHMIIDQNRPMAVHADGKVSGWTWASGGMGFSLVGATNAADLHPIADAIRSQVTTSS